MNQQIGLTNPEEKKIDEIEVTSRLLNIILDMPFKQQLDLLTALDKNGYHGARKHTRTMLKNPWVVLVDSETKNKSSHYSIKDISRCGMFIETDQAFLVGEKITVKFKIPTRQRLYKIMGEIVRSQVNGIGIKFKRHQSEN